MDFSAFLSVVVTLFALMVIGFLLGKLNIMDEVASKRFSKLILTVAQPCLIVASLLKMEYSEENLGLGFLSFAVGFAVHLFMVLIAFLLTRGFKSLDEQKLSEFSMVFGNIGFLGLPILDSLFGDKGVFMGAFFVASFNVLIWTLGIAILAKGRSDIKVTVKKVFLNYGTVPCAIGLILFVLNSELPSFFTSTVNYLGNLCTPISTLIIGGLLSRSSLKKTFLSLKTYYTCFSKLIIMPLIICVIMKLIGIDAMWIMVVVTVAAMPSATTVSMMAETYDISPEYSARAVGLSSILSIITMPLIIKLAEFIVNM